MKYSKEWLREDELRKMLSLSDLEEKYEIWMLLLYSPALRVSEAINVRMRDLNLKDGSIDVYGGKGYDETEVRKVWCDMQALRRIMMYCEHNKLKPNDYVMFSNKGKQVSR